MSKLKRIEKREAELADLEHSFEVRLREALHVCARGQYGLFGQNDATFRGYGAGAADELLALADRIGEMRSSLGFVEPFGLAERFKAYRAMRGANVPGEPKLAKQFLEEQILRSNDRTEFD